MRIWILLLFFAPLPGVALAQFDSGQISGFVRDDQEAAIPGAAVTVTNERNADHRTTVTNSTGFYVFPDVPVGVYSITVELIGFKKFTQTDLRLSAASQVAVDATLQVGSLEETVEVTASPSQVQAASGQVARTIDTRQIQALTLNGPTWNLDFGVRKSVPITATQRLEFRVEAFNVLNHPNWGAADNNPTSGSFGRVTGKVGERVIQLATKYTF